MSVYSSYDLSYANYRNVPLSGHYADYKPNNKPTSEVRCQQRMLQKLMELKKQNLLRKAFLLESNEFEILEFYGDAYLYERITKNILRSRRFMDPNLMTTLRRYCIKNDNLAVVFDQLGLVALLDPTCTQENGSSTSIDIGSLTRKNKADIVEAIIGEIAENRPEEDLLSELVAFISYVGEKEYFKEHHNHVLEPSRNSKRSPKNFNDHRYYDNNNSKNNYNNHPSNTSGNTNSQPTQKEAPVFFLNNAKSSPPPKSEVKTVVKNEPLKILKRGETNTNVTSKNEITPQNLYENSSGSPSLLSAISKMNAMSDKNVFFRNANLPTQGPSFVPSMTSTRNGMDFKEKTNF